jgi:hypothetical protein
VLAPGAPGFFMCPNPFSDISVEPPLADRGLPIWDLKTSRVFHAGHQVWVHIAFTRYRNAYRKAFPAESIDGKVLKVR